MLFYNMYVVACLRYVKGEGWLCELLSHLLELHRVLLNYFSPSRDVSRIACPRLPQCVTHIAFEIESSDVRVHSMCRPRTCIKPTRQQDALQHSTIVHICATTIASVTELLHLQLAQKPFRATRPRKFFPEQQKTSQMMQRRESMSLVYIVLLAILITAGKERADRVSSTVKFSPCILNFQNSLLSDRLPTLLVTAMWTVTVSAGIPDGKKCYVKAPLNPVEACDGGIGMCVSKSLLRKSILHVLHCTFILRPSESRLSGVIPRTGNWQRRQLRALLGRESLGS